MQDFDVVVIGAGVAGLTAATTAAQHGLTVCVLERLGPGGQAMNAAMIENWPGAPDGIAGVDLGPALFEQASAAGAEIMLDTVLGIAPDRERHRVDADGGSTRAKAVIIAAGSAQRALGVPGYDRLLGKGISHCAICDGPLYRGKRVAVVGGGDAALDAATTLCGLADKVLLLHRGRALSGQRDLIDRSKGLANLQMRPATVVAEILGEARVESLLLRDLDTGHDATETVDAVFVHIGLAPNTAFLGGTVELDAHGRIVTDAMMRASMQGIYAAGDIRSGSAAMFAEAAEDGATAANACWRDLTGQR